MSGKTDTYPPLYARIIIHGTMAKEIMDVYFLATARGLDDWLKNH